MGASLTQRQIRETELPEIKTKYRLTNRCLGKGADATIYLATDIATKKQVVCKVVSLLKCKIHHAARLRSESELLRKLQHPNILPYIEGFQSQQNLYTFTELASGGDLMSFLFRHEQVKEHDARVIVRQLVAGLEFLHTHGIVHRDLKPENVLLAYSPRIAYHRVMLADFGASAVPGRNRMTTSVGTKSYQAPECLSGHKPHSTAADIWSLSIIAQMLVAEDDYDRDRPLGYYSQEDVDEILQQCFAHRQPAASESAQAFVVACLRIACNTRMDILDAKKHDWLCKPKCLLNHIRAQEERMLADWKSEIPQRPKLTQLPTLESLSDHSNPPDADSPQERALDSSDKASEYFVKPDLPLPKKKILALSCKTDSDLLKTGIFNFYGQPPVRNPDNEVSLIAVPKRRQPETSTTQASEGLDDTVVLQSSTPRKAETQPVFAVGMPSTSSPLPTPTEKAYPWTSSKKHQRVYQTSARSQVKKKSSSKAPQLANGHFATPHSNLVRHLPQPKGGPPRKLVLGEIQRTKQPFLKNSEASFQSLSPSSTSTVPLEPNCKRRRTGPASDQRG